MSEWTVDTLKEHFEQRFQDSDKAVQAALQATKEAVLKAEVATEKRFESVNEFRAQLADQSSNLMPRSEYTVQHKALEDKISELTDRFNQSEGANKGSQITKGTMFAAIGALGTILGIVVLVANGKL